MADESKKSSLPAWQQQASQSGPKNNQSETSSTSTSNTTSDTRPPPAESPSPKQTDATPSTSTETKAAASTAPAPAPSTSVENAEEEQREQIRKFLKDPAVEGQSAEKKKAFLQSKGMPAGLIEEELATSQQASSLSQSDFESFKQQNTVAKPSSDPVHAATATPPIITYPEFLATAHRPSPLITPGRILTTTYIASAAAALLYGASTLLVKPMSAVLTDARHEFATHSQSKLDELNARLEKMVSQVPGAKANADNDSDADSLASDPTELYHRDIGTQTDSSVHTSKAPASVAFVNNDSAVAHAEKMQGLEKNLDTLLKGIQKQGDATREREESVSKLRHYLDSLAYNGGVNVWSNNGVGYGWEPSLHAAQKAQEKKSDSIEDLKKEIRGVKGVLLSAKRFPAAAQNGPSNRYRSPAQAPA